MCISAEGFLSQLYGCRTVHAQPFPPLQEDAERGGDGGWEQDKARLFLETHGKRTKGKKGQVTAGESLFCEVKKVSKLAGTRQQAARSDFECRLALRGS